MHPADSNFKIILNSNKIISLYEIHSSLTYSGLLEGLPNRKMNKDIISGLAEETNRKIYNASKLYIIKPEEVLIEVEPGHTKLYRDRMVKEHGDDWELMGIPRIECISSFESESITDDYMGSNLTIA